MKAKGQFCSSMELIPRSSVDFNVALAIANEGEF